MTNRWKAMAIAMLATTAGGCVYMPSDGPTAPVGYASIPPQRDTMAANARHVLGPKLVTAQSSQRPVFQAQRANAAFDEAVAANQAIGNAEPDYVFTLAGVPMRGWGGNDGASLYVEGDGETAIQYLFEPESDTPLLIGTSRTIFVFDDWRLIGAFTPAGVPLSAGALINADAEAQLLLVRARTIHRVAIEGEPQAQRQPQIAAYQPVVSSVTWSPWLYSSWGGFDPWYDRYRSRRDSRERHDRWRERRRDRHAGDGRHGPGTHPRRPGHGDYAGAPGQQPPPGTDTPTRGDRPDWPGPGPGAGDRRNDRGGGRRDGALAPRPRAMEAEPMEEANRPAPVMPTVPEGGSPPPRFDRAPRPAPAPASAPRFVPPPAPTYSAPAPAPAAAPAPSYSPPPPPVAAPPARMDTPRSAPDTNQADVRPD